MENFKVDDIVRSLIDGLEYKIIGSIKKPYTSITGVKYPDPGYDFAIARHPVPTNDFGIKYTPIINAMEDDIEHL